MADRYIPFSSPDENDPNQYITKACRLVRELIELRRPYPLGKDEKFTVYVTTFTKTLQNWKAMVSTSIADGNYYEVTYDGDKGLAYVDRYGKISQDVIWDDLGALQATTRKTLEDARDARIATIAENEAVANSEGMRFGNIKSMRAENEAYADSDVTLEDHVDQRPL